MLESASQGEVCLVLGGGVCLVPGGGVCLVPGVVVSAWSQGGVCLVPGGSAWSGGVWHPSMHWGRHPPCGQIHTCKNITLATTSLRAVKISTNNVNCFLRNPIRAYSHLRGLWSDLFWITSKCCLLWRTLITKGNFLNIYKTNGWNQYHSDTSGYSTKGG